MTTATWAILISLCAPLTAAIGVIYGMGRIRGEARAEKTASDKRIAAMEVDMREHKAADGVTHRAIAEGDAELKDLLSENRLLITRMDTELQAVMSWKPQIHDRVHSIAQDVQRVINTPQEVARLDERVNAHADKDQLEISRLRDEYHNQGNWITALAVHVELLSGKPINFRRRGEHKEGGG